MNPKPYGLVLAFLAFCAPAFGQQTGVQWFITPNVNLYLPVGTPYKGVYPVLWYDKETTPKVLIGGFGVGVSALKPYGEKLTLKGQANLSKHTYWDEPMQLIDENGAPIRDYLAGSSDYTLGLTATGHYQFTGKFSAGTGLGGQVLLVSLVRLPPNYFTGPDEEQLATSRYYKRLVPMLPVELSLKLEKILFNVRYEHGLLNRLRKPLADYQTDRFGLLSFEVGFRL
jgi:hypothetical protein